MNWINDLVEFFSINHGASMATLTTDTLPKVNKGKGDSSFVNVFGNRTIHKIATRHVSIGHRYATSVNNRVDKVIGEHEFIEPLQRTWGERIGKTVLFTHKDEIYLEYFYLNANSKKSTFIYTWNNGDELTSQELLTAKTMFNLDPGKKISSTQSNAGLTEDNAVIVNCIKLTNIREIHAFGKTLTQETVLI